MGLFLRLFEIEAPADRPPPIAANMRAGGLVG